MSAPQKFVRWLAKHKHRDPKYGFTYMYHPRSDAHSVALCTFVLEDLLDQCGVLREQAAQGLVAYGINVLHSWPTRKRKTIDLGLGLPVALEPGPSVVRGIRKAKEFSRVLFSCEAKTVMTEHKKSQPRVFDELSSSHEIVHQGDQQAIAAGIAVVNIADTFVSPLRQKSRRQLVISKHRQPAVTESMIRHLGGLPIRAKIGEVGFDAYCTLVINCDNQTTATLWIEQPSPQSGDPNHYDTFVARICRSYAHRFSTIS